MEARQQRLEEEEAQKQIQDRIFAAENAATRQEAIDRAKELQYFGSDIVKNFHSRVMLLQVLQVKNPSFKIYKVIRNGIYKFKRKQPMLKNQLALNTLKWKKKLLLKP